MGQSSSGVFDGQGTGTFAASGQSRWVTMEYDFARHGGAQSSIVIGTLAAGTAVIGGYMNVETVPVGVGASIGVTAEAAGDVVAVAAIAGAPWSTTGRKAILPKRNTPEAASTIVATVARNVLFVISAADLTAGKVQLHLELR